MILFSGFDELVTLEGARKKRGRHIVESDLSIVRKGALVVDPKSRKLSFVGRRADVPRVLRSKIKKEVDLKSASVFPGLVECHTHSLFGGNRILEFEKRNQGATYQEIAAAGGGILSTLQATRTASNPVLKNILEERLRQFARQGVTCVEVKTGYALDLTHELRQLRLLKAYADFGDGPEVVSTYLGAHAIPPEFARAEDYLQFMIQKVFPEIQKWTSRVDIFVEKGFFTLEQGRAYAKAARDRGLNLTVHAEQLSLSGGAKLAVEMDAKSADHLIQIDDETIRELAKSEVTCVGLPLADLYMKCAYPPLRSLCEAGARVAIATDFNPGTSPSQDLTLTGLLARLQCGLSLPQVLSAYTVAASFALGLEDRKGALIENYDADFFSSSSSWNELFYSPGSSHALQVFRGGRRIHSA